MKLRRGIFVWICLIGLALTATASLAWACTTTPVVSIRPGTGPAGTDVIVTGANFRPGPVEIRWNSASGPLALTAGGMDAALRSQADLVAFRSEQSGPNVFKVPSDLPSGVYYLLAVQRDSQGAITGKAATTFQVTLGSPDSQSIRSAGSTSSELWTAFESDGASRAAVTGEPGKPIADSLALQLGLPLVAIGLAGTGAALTLAASSKRRTRS